MKRHYSKLLCGAAAVAILSGAGVAHAEDRAQVRFDIPSQPLTSALNEFGIQSGSAVLFKADVTGQKLSRAFSGASDPETALMAMLDGTGLSYRREGQAFVIVSASDPQSGSAAGDGADQGTVAALIVTAQKREEEIQDVPIAISAFTEKSLQEQKIEGGFDLLKAIPNVTFSKNNFSGYNFSIRGIGTKAVSVTTDPGVAVSFNSTTLIRNRLFEQEYFDVERVEVLRGPQGTLYGRNATSGVINVISAKPNLSEFSGWIKGEVGNYHSKRVSAMVNVPLIADKLAVRFAGALTDRQGYGVDLYDNTHIDGRDLWSGRISVGFQPTDTLHADLIWERFNEDDDRARTSKQLCTRDPGPDQIGNVTLPALDEDLGHFSRGRFSQGCLPGSLYDPKAFGTPNGTSLPFVLFLEGFGMGSGGLTQRPGCPNSYGGIYRCLFIIPDSDPYNGLEQSHDLRAIYSQIKPVYRANADVVQLNMSWDVTPSLQLVSQTAYNKDKIYSTQDYNRYTTYPVFTDTAGLVNPLDSSMPGLTSWLAPGGIYCDPQLGCSNTIVGMDLSRAKSSQFSQEFRLQSNWDGRFNFSAGATYTRYQTIEDYYVFFNVLNVIAVLQNISPFGGRTASKFTLHPDCAAPGQFNTLDGLICVPIETNPISDIQDIGHNYFLSRNPYKLDSKGIFGEAYWNFSDALRLTVGLRYTRDQKIFTPVPSELFLSDPARLDAYAGDNPFWNLFRSFPLHSFASGAYPSLPAIKRSWGEVTGRIGVDWKPDLSFTDQTMLYAFYSRGYKGGGMNPPRIGLNYDALAAGGTILAPSAPPEFRPEFVNAYEIGAKNTLLGGAMTFNADAFFYDYKDYQVSKIVDRTANNENFDATVWGLEFETLFQPTRNLRLNGSLGYLDSKLGDGSRSIDVMNRTAGHPGWMVVRPSILLTSNCIAPIDVVALAIGGADGHIASNAGEAQFLCPGGNGFGANYANLPPFGQTLPDGSTYDPAMHPEANYGAGFFTDVSGHELPNSPHFTVTLGAQYSIDFLEGWKATIRADGYWQSQSWARVYELPIDKLHGWYNANLSLWVENEDGLKIEFYAKNILDKSPITDTFTNSDDTDLTTNVFVLDPRLIGLSIKKDF